MIRAMCGAPHTDSRLVARFELILPDTDPVVTHPKEKVMGKERHGTKEAKKQAVLTHKEKKTAKQVKKQEKLAPHPLIPH